MLLNKDSVFFPFFPFLNKSLIAVIKSLFCPSMVDVCVRGADNWLLLNKLLDPEEPCTDLIEKTFYL